MLKAKRILPGSHRLGELVPSQGFAKESKFTGLFLLESGKASGPTRVLDSHQKGERIFL